MQFSAFTTSYGSKQNRLINEATVYSGDDMMYTNAAQWDTGATKTCISQAVVDRLGLISTAQTLVRTPSGEKVFSLYVVDIQLKNNVIVRDVQVIGSEIGAQSIDLLIGMDIIGLGDFAVTNVAGKTVFTFRIPSVEVIDFLTES